MASRYKGCKLCKPHKAMGNSKHAVKAAVRKLLDKARYRG